MGTPNSFNTLLDASWSDGKAISVGLDPEPSRFPEDLRSTDLDAAVVEFNRRVIEGTCRLAAAYKPNIAFYEGLDLDGLRVLRQTIDLVREMAPGVPVIIDAKRADIGNTNEKYAQAIFDVLGADALTVHPYMGPETMKPFIDRADKGLIVLCRTSNPGADRYQDLMVNGRPLYQHIAEDVATTWNVNGNCGLVVGATYPEEMKSVRSLAGDMPILVPGVGAQGGDVEATVHNGLDSRGHGLLLHAGRSIMYAFAAHPGMSVQDASAAEMETLHAQIQAALAGP